MKLRRPSKHKTTQRWKDVGPSFATLTQHHTTQRWKDVSPPFATLTQHHTNPG